MLLIIVSWCVFQYKYTFGCQHILFKYEHGYIVNILQSIRRPGENEIVSLGVLLHEFEYITFYDLQFVADAECGSGLFYEEYIALVALYEGEVFGPARCQLIADTARAAKQVAGLDAFQVQHVLECIEQAFFGYISGWPCRCRSGRAEPAPAEYAAYNAHAYNCCSR